LAATGIVVYLLAVPGWLGAMPSFARQTSLGCQACHNSVPRLGAAGEEFLWRGFRAGGDNGEPSHAWDGKNLFDLVSLRLISSADHASFQIPPAGIADSAVHVPRLLGLSVAGNLWQSAGIWLDGDYDFSQQKPLFHIQRGFVVIHDLGPPGVAHIKLGLFEHGFLLPLQPRQLLDGHTEPRVAQSTPSYTTRWGNTPLAYAHKFYGLTAGVDSTADDFNWVVGQGSMLHHEGDDGVALYGRPWGPASGFIYQLGMVQAQRVDSESDRLDAYAVLRYDFQLANGTRWQTTVFQYHANHAALAVLPLNGSSVKADNGDTSIQRTGFGFHAAWDRYELEGVYVMDRMDEPQFNNAALSDGTWELQAGGYSLQGLWHYRDDTVIFARIDSMSPGGLRYLPTAVDAAQTQINNWQGVLGLGGRYYWRETIMLGAGVYLSQTPRANPWPAVLGGGIHPSANHTDYFKLLLDVIF